MPYAICRSALFAPIKRGKRLMLNNIQIAARADVQITYTGPLLDMADSDVFLALLHIARGMIIQESERIYFQRGRLLRLLGRCQGKRDYDWLHRSLKRLTAAMLELKAQKISGLHLIDDYDYDPQEGDWYVRLSPRIVRLFAENTFALIEWDQRLALSAPLAKWLQTYIASHTKGKEHRISLAHLQAWSGNAEGRARQFRATLAKSLNELQAQGAIVSWELTRGSKGEPQARWVRSCRHDLEG